MSPFIRYGGLSVGGQLPVLDVDPKDIRTVFYQLGRILNITGVPHMCSAQPPLVWKLLMNLSFSGSLLRPYPEGCWDFPTVHGE